MTFVIKFEVSIIFAQYIGFTFRFPEKSVFGGTHRLNEAVKRNPKRFPKDFMFQLTEDEWKSLRSQTAISSNNRGGRRFTPFVFTEQKA